jgi:hypothetical protein
MIVMHGKLTAVALSTMGSSAGSQSGVAATQIAEWAPDTELYRSEADDLGLRTRHDRSPDPTRQHVGGGVDWPIPCVAADLPSRCGIACAHANLPRSSRNAGEPCCEAGSSLFFIANFFPFSNPVAPLGG